MKTIAILLAAIIWGKLDPTTRDVTYYDGEPRPDAEMRADGWKEVVETREAKPIGSLADYKFVWLATDWVEDALTISRVWRVRFCDDIKQVTTNDVVEAETEVAE